MIGTVRKGKGLIFLERRDTVRSVGVMALIILLISCFSLFVVNYTPPTKQVEIELGNISDSSELNAEFRNFTRSFVDSKKEVISVLKSVTYEETEYSFGESEVIRIIFYDRDRNEKDSVWYAVEYDTKELYAMYNGQYYKISDSKSFLKEIGAFLNVDKYLIYDVSLELESESLSDGNVVYELGTCRTMRFFYNSELENQQLRFPEKDTNKNSTDINLDKYSASKIAADAVGVQLYRASPFYDKYSENWLVTIVDEVHYQKMISIVEECDGEMVCYNRYWDVIIDKTGNVLYYLVPYYEDEDSGVVIIPNVNSHE